MNKVAQTFKGLLEVLAHEPESPAVSTLLAEVAAGVAASGQVTCLALQTRLTAYWPLRAAAALLEPHGVVLRARPRLKRDGVWIFAEPLAQPQPSPIAGAGALEPEPDEAEVVLLRAA